MRRGATPSAGLLSILAAGLFAGACFKSLDESLLDGASGAGAGATGGLAGTGGAAGSAGVGGGGAAGGGAGGTGGILEDAGPDVNDASDAETPIQVLPHDPARFPATSIAGATGNSLISVDGSFAYYILADTSTQTPTKVPLTGGSGAAAGGDALDNASYILGPPQSLFLYLGVGNQATEDGRIVRFFKEPESTNPAVELTHAHRMGRVTAMVATTSAPFYLFAVAKTAGPGQPHILRADMAGGGSQLEAIYTDPTGNRTGGALVAQRGCVYWTTNGGVYTVPYAGGDRAAALATQVSDATSLASDGTRLFVARADGSIWQRPLLGASCDGSGPPEQRILSGFTGATELVSYARRLAFIASDSELGEGGVFSYDLDARVVEQAVPASVNARLLRHSGPRLVYRTSSGTIARVPDGT
ncbi:MAG: hypothetical protein KF915_05400 [Polyangiaceae bacterium]|nr:hypothetical protein [Polyangiaceae bacterium]